MDFESLILQLDMPQAFKEHDAEHLSALVDLTELDLGINGCGPSVDASILYLLAVEVKHLRVLGINHTATCNENYGCISTSVFHAINGLTDLQKLRVEDLEHDVAAWGLELLTAFVRLPELEGLIKQGMKQYRSSGTALASNAHDIFVILPST